MLFPVQRKLTVAHSPANANNPIRVALGGLGVALGPLSLVSDDLSEGRLVAPFPGIVLPGRSYYYCPAEQTSDSAVIAFRDWLKDAAKTESPN